MYTHVRTPPGLIFRLTLCENDRWHTATQALLVLQMMNVSKLRQARTIEIRPQLPPVYQNIFYSSPSSLFGGGDSHQFRNWCHYGLPNTSCALNRALGLFPLRWFTAVFRHLSFFCLRTAVFPLCDVVLAPCLFVIVSGQTVLQVTSLFSARLDAYICVFILLLSSSRIYKRTRMSGAHILPR